MKKTHGLKNGEPEHDAAANFAMERKLKGLLNNSPIYIVLQWFDAIESVKVSSKLTAKR